MSVHTQIKKDWEEAIKKAIMNRLSSVEPSFLDAEFIYNPDDIIRSNKDFTFKMLKGRLGTDNVLKNLGLVRSLKRDADHLIIVGEFNNGAWSNLKRIWVKRSTK